MFISRAVRFSPASPAKKHLIKFLADSHHIDSASVFRSSVAIITSRTFSDKVELSDDACPQGIQGDDCDTFKLWTETCRRYGLANCNEQLQGIQTGKKTLAEVLKEQEDLIANIAAQYKVKTEDRFDTAQGVQDDMSAFPTIDSPCPQGVQGDDCARFKLWLENCHRFGFQDCMQQYASFKEGRKTLAQIFEEQDKTIREVISTYRIQKRNYSTSAGPEGRRSSPETRY